MTRTYPRRCVERDFYVESGEEAWNSLELWQVGPGRFSGYFKGDSVSF
jgi:hypothetical protein